MKNHFLVLSTLHIVIGFLELLIASLLAFAIVGGGLLSGDLKAISITSIIGVGLGSAFAVTAIPSIIGGLGLHFRKEWARIVLIIVGVISLPLVIPFGAILGIYTIWVLTRSEASELLGQTEGENTSNGGHSAAAL